jgi:hypothetical protein
MLLGDGDNSCANGAAGVPDAQAAARPGTGALRIHLVADRLGVEPLAIL